MDAKEAIVLYETNRTRLSRALLDAHGDPEIVLAKHGDLLMTMALNNIEITAKCNTPRSEVKAA